MTTDILRIYHQNLDLCYEYHDSIIDALYANRTCEIEGTLSSNGVVNLRTRKLLVPSRFEVGNMIYDVQELTGIDITNYDIVVTGRY